MAEWVYVEGNEIKEYHGALPKSWKNISGLDKANDAFLLSQGWYRVEKQYQTFDENAQENVGYNYEILSDRVVESLKLRTLTEEDINNRNQRKKDNFFNSLRSQRNRLLAESDWTQVVDLQNSKSVDWIDLWKSYRQQLRDLPAKYENDNNYDYSSVMWPSTPSTPKE